MHQCICHSGINVVGAAVGRARVVASWSATKLKWEAASSCSSAMMAARSTALRRLGDRHWFDLNSMAKTPQEMSPAHVDLFLQAHFEKGYSVFAVRGAFPSHRLERDAGALAAAVASTATAAPIFGRKSHGPPGTSRARGAIC